MINVGIIFTSSNDFAKNALKKPADEKSPLVNNTNKKVNVMLSIRALVKKRDMINIIAAMINHRTIHPLINANITSYGFMGDTSISSIDF